jgi:hypothetical protein
VNASLKSYTLKYSSGQLAWGAPSALLVRKSTRATLGAAYTGFTTFA